MNNYIQVTTSCYAHDTALKKMSAKEINLFILFIFTGPLWTW